MPMKWTDAAERHLLLAMLQHNNAAHNFKDIAEALNASGKLEDTVTANAIAKQWKSIKDKDAKSFENAGDGDGQPATPKATPKRRRGKKAAADDDAGGDDETPESPIKKPKSAKKEKPKVKEEPVEEDEEPEV